MEDRLRTWGPVVAAWLAMPLVFAALRTFLPAIGGDRASDVPPIAPRSAPAPAPEGPGRSDGCLGCHAEQAAAWRSSTHAAAERELGDGDPREITAVGVDGVERVYPLVRAIGVEPLVQYLVEVPGTGRLQVTQSARRTADGAWFDVFADGRGPGEWGHWTGNGMVWNSRCGECHTTGFAKGLVQQTGYQTTFTELGVGCAACHVVPAGHGAEGGPAAALPDVDTCASCHARRAALTEDFRPGEDLLDHFAPALVDRSDTFRPDGGVRDEDFEYNAFLGAKMHGAGVTCASCHDPHTGRTRGDGDATCLACHAALPTFRPDHAHHDASDAACVACHMPTTVYMQADTRHDHAFTIPDPALGRAERLPDACSACHPAGGPVDVVAAAARWWGRGAPSPRSLAFARARRDDPAAIPALLTALAAGPVGLRAGAARHLEGFVGRDDVRSALAAAAADPEPLVRFAAAESLGGAAGDPAVENALRPLLRDPVRAVRVGAARSLRARLGPGSVEARDYAAYLDLHVDDPSALVERGTWALERGELGSARMDLESALGLDPGSVPALDSLALLAARAGRPADALDYASRAAALAPDDGELAFRKALAQVEAGDAAGGQATLRALVDRQPTFARAWYNLGLLEARAGGTAGLDSLRRAVDAAPDDPDVRYGLAAVLAATDPAAAKEEARRVLALDPAHPGARALAGVGGEGREPPPVP